MYPAGGAERKESTRDYGCGMRAKRFDPARNGCAGPGVVIRFGAVADAIPRRFGREWRTVSARSGDGFFRVEATTSGAET